MTFLTIIVVLLGCSEDTEVIAPPKAGFTVEVNGLTAKFTNTSTLAEKYMWDFGDGKTETSPSPTHVYEKAAAYIVKLKAINAEGKEDESTQALELSFKIVIDGEFSDWKDVPTLSTRNADSVGVVSLVKATSDLAYIYFYVEGDDALYGFTQTYINSDGDKSTGWSPENHPESGADYELDAGETPELWPWNGTDGSPDWAFEGEVIKDATMYTPIKKTGNAYEFALLRAKIPGLADKISFAIGDVDLGTDGEQWNEHGHLPNPGENYIELELFK